MWSIKEKVKKYFNQEAKHLLQLYQLGSFVVLIIGLMTAALVCSWRFAQTELRRAAIYEHQIRDFFGFHYRKIGEEMWTQNYESIFLRVKEIARQLGKAEFDVKLVNEWGDCQYYADERVQKIGCKTTPQETEFVSNVSPKGDTEAKLRFDSPEGVYKYAAPLYVGSVYKGVLFTSLSDPYGFHLGSSIQNALENFVFAGALVVGLWLLWLWLSRVLLLSKYTAVLADMEKKQAVAKLAAQLSHDIRSPLSALSVLVDSARTALPSAQSQMLRLAVSRITSIADDLLKKYRNPQAGNEPEFTLLSGVVHTIVSEKSVVLHESNVKLISKYNDSLSYLGVRLSQNKLQRCLSNLVNNSIDAVEQKGKANIVIEVTKIPKIPRFNKEMACLSVSDNGKGMDPRTLHRVRTVGGSFGKLGGNGIGLAFVKEAVAEAGGQLEIESSPGKGTIVRLYLPIEAPPRWLTTSLSLKADQTVIVLDDDESMHAFWAEKLSGRNVVHLRDPEEFTLERYPVDRCTYLFDYEIQGAPLTGLDLILMYRLGSRATLVTSYFADQEIQSKIQEAGANLLPKFLAPKFHVLGPKPKTPGKDTKPTDPPQLGELVQH